MGLFQKSRRHTVQPSRERQAVLNACSLVGIDTVLTTTLLFSVRVRSVRGISHDSVCLPLRMLFVQIRMFTI